MFYHFLPLPAKLIIPTLHITISEEDILVEHLSDLMLLGDAAKPTQRKITVTQTTHRVKLVKAWKIHETATVLEVGCSQGDTTVVLANAVGPNGKVVGVDIANEDYGSPCTVGNSMKHLKKGPKLIITLILILKSLRSKSKTLCFAEYLPYVPQNTKQIPHYLALCIQAQIQVRLQDNQANIHTLFTPNMIRKSCEEAGWKITHEMHINSPELQDAGWEVADLLSKEEQDLELAAKGDQKWLSLVKAQIETLKEAKERTVHCETLPSWAFVAE